MRCEMSAVRLHTVRLTSPSSAVLRGASGIRSPMLRYGLERFQPSALSPKADKSHEIIKRVSRVNQASGKVFRAPFRHMNAMCARRERQMSCGFDSSRIEQVIMLGGLALFLVLATIMPA